MFMERKTFFKMLEHEIKGICWKTEQKVKRKFV
jgi:hypothetical protein